MTRIIYRERLVTTDPRLRRVVHHDSESRRYAFDTTGLAVRSVVHDRHIPILDQGSVGSCTGNAGIGALGTDPFYGDLPQRPVEILPLNERGAQALYSDAEIIDGDGPYPPNDNGSSGLSIAKALLHAGYIVGYQHTFSVDDALKALSVTPWIFGTNWYEAMFSPDLDGRLHIGGALAGGHELLVREYDAMLQRLWLDNSWGIVWGLAGRCYLSLDDFATLLIDQGDVTIFLPLSQPAPVPTPLPPVPSDADAALAAVAIPWVARRHSGHNVGMWHATQAWLKAKGL